MRVCGLYRKAVNCKNHSTMDFIAVALFGLSDPLVWAGVAVGFVAGALRWPPLIFVAGAAVAYSMFQRLIPGAPGSWGSVEAFVAAAIASLPLVMAYAGARIVGQRK